MLVRLFKQSINNYQKDIDSINVLLDKNKIDLQNALNKLKKGKEQLERTKREIDKLEKNLEGLHWYNKEILKLYAIDFKKNAKELSRKTGIPYMSLVRTINKTKKQMKTNIRK
jgi:ribosomal protein S2